MISLLDQGSNIKAARQWMKWVLSRQGGSWGGGVWDRRRPLSRWEGAGVSDHLPCSSTVPDEGDTEAPGVRSVGVIFLEEQFLECI